MPTTGPERGGITIQNSHVDTLTGKPSLEAAMQAETLSDADIDVLFATIGKYVVIFQHIEGVLDQILLLGWDDENWSASQIKLSEMTNKQKVDAMENMVLTSPVFARARARQVWCAYFKEVVKRLHDERQRRNSVVHSQYLFE